MKVTTAASSIGAAGLDMQISFTVMESAQVGVMKWSHRFRAAGRSAGLLQAMSLTSKSCWLIRVQAGLAQRPFRLVPPRILFTWGLAARRQVSIVFRFLCLRAVLRGRSRLRAGWCIFAQWTPTILTFRLPALLLPSQLKLSPLRGR